MKTVTKILIILPILFNIAVCQVNQEWVVKYNDSLSLSDIARAVVTDKMGNVYITGSITTTYYNATNFATVKYSENGIQQWVKIYNSNFGDASSIAIDDSSNLYVAGTSQNNFTTIKYNSAGAQQWVRSYSNVSDDVVYGVKVDRFGNVYVGGSSVGTGTGFDYCIVKYNSNGTQLWVARYNDTLNRNDYSKGLAVDRNGNVYVTGYTVKNENESDYCTIKFNSNGAQQWVRKYNGPGNFTDGAFAIALDSSGNVIITGYSTGNNTSADFCTIKYDSNGLQKWIVRYNGPANGYDGAWVIAADKNGNVIVGGESPGINSGVDYCTIKYDSNGVEQWAVRYDGPKNSMDGIRAMTIDSSDNVYITGISVGENNNYKSCTIKYDSEGNLKWIQRFGDYQSGSFGIVVDNYGNVIVTGYSNLGPGFYSDYCTIKYSQAIGIQEISSKNPINFKLLQNYPNPFNPTTKIKFDTPPSKGDRGMTVRLCIYDILGREIAVLGNEGLRPGTYEVEWNGDNYPSGVYFYRLVVSEAEPLTVSDALTPLSILYSETKKMILLK